MYLQKVISRKNCVKNLFFAGILKVNDKNSRVRIQDPDPDPNLDYSYSLQALRSNTSRKS
jgi:hypothetical protein